MNISEILNQAYNSGMLTLSIVLLAIAIMTYPTIRKHSDKQQHSPKQK